MNERKAKDVIDAFEKVEKIAQSRPPLPKGLLPSYLKLIDLIYHISKQGKVKVSDLSTHMNQTMPSITRSLKAMEEMKLVKKENSSKDKRIVYISLTDKGNNIYQKYVKTYYSKLSKRLSIYKDSDLDKMIQTINLIYDDLMTNPIEMEETKWTITMTLHKVLS